MGLTVSREKKNSLKFTRQPSKEVIFFNVNRQKCRLKLTVKKFQGI